MPFECPDCRSQETVEGAFFEMCGRCGWSSVDHNEHARLLQLNYREHWRDKPIAYWIARLMQEMGEAASASVGDHDDPLAWELIQIKAICGNLLDRLGDKW